MFFYKKNSLFYCEIYNYDVTNYYMQTTDIHMHNSGPETDISTIPDVFLYNLYRYLCGKKATEISIKYANICLFFLPSDRQTIDVYIIYHNMYVNIYKVCKYSLIFYIPPDINIYKE